MRTDHAWFCCVQYAENMQSGVSERVKSQYLPCLFAWYCFQTAFEISTIAVQ